MLLICWGEGIFSELSHLVKCSKMRRSEGDFPKTRKAVGRIKTGLKTPITQAELCVAINSKDCIFHVYNISNTLTKEIVMIRPYEFSRLTSTSCLVL